MECKIPEKDSVVGKETVHKQSVLAESYLLDRLACPHRYRSRILPCYKLCSLILSTDGACSGMA